MLNSQKIDIWAIYVKPEQIIIISVVQCGADKLDIVCRHDCSSDNKICLKNHLTKWSPSKNEEIDTKQSKIDQFV